MIPSVPVLFLPFGSPIRVFVVDSNELVAVLSELHKLLRAAKQRSAELQDELTTACRVHGRQRARLHALTQELHDTAAEAAARAPAAEQTRHQADSTRGVVEERIRLTAADNAKLPLPLRARRKPASRATEGEGGTGEQK